MQAYRNHMEEWESEKLGPVELKVDEISDSQLTELIKSYIVPEGSDFALTADAFEAKERLARKQIATGSLKIIFDAASDSTMLMAGQDWRNLKSK